MAERPVEPKICDYCGGYITEVGQRCPARHDGQCRESVLFEE